MAGPIRIRPDRHTILDCEFSRHIRRALPSVEGLFVYRHRDSENLVLARWINSDKRYALEIMVLGKRVAEITRETVKELRYRLSHRITKRELDLACRKGEKFLDETTSRANADYDWDRRTHAQVGYGD